MRWESDDPRRLGWSIVLQRCRPATSLTSSIRTCVAVRRSSGLGLNCCSFWRASPGRRQTRRDNPLRMSPRFRPRFRAVRDRKLRMKRLLERAGLQNRHLVVLAARVARHVRDQARAIQVAGARHFYGGLLSFLHVVQIKAALKKLFETGIDLTGGPPANYFLTI